MKTIKLLLTISVCSLLTNSSLALTINSGYVETHTEIDGGSTQTNKETGIKSPGNYIARTDAGNGTFAKAEINILDNGDEAKLSIDVLMNRTGGVKDGWHDIAQLGFEFSFTVLTDMIYDYSGFMQAVDKTTPGMLVLMSGFRLGDSSFSSSEFSTETANERFIVEDGVATGDFSSTYNTTSGNPETTGILRAGETYSISVLTWIQAFPDADGGAEAFGNFTLELSQPVSDSGTTILLSLFSLTTIVLARKSRSRRSLLRDAEG